MPRTVYVNGEFLPEQDATISIFDRSFLFADGVYEVTSVFHGKMVDNDAHLERLKCSLKAIGIQTPASNSKIIEIQQQLIEQNDLSEGLIYLQVSRGSADRDFMNPKGVEPTLVLFTQAKNLRNNPKAETGIHIISLPEIRWQRRDIKSVGLLPACMAKNAAAAQGADDAWFVEGEHVTEGASNNAYIVTADNRIITRQLGNEILAGITRQTILRFAEESDYIIEERPFTLEEAFQAKEAFITSASTIVLPVVKIDDRSIGTGLPGSVTKRLREIYISQALAD